MKLVSIIYTCFQICSAVEIEFDAWNTVDQRHQHINININERRTQKTGKRSYKGYRNNRAVRQALKTLDNVKHNHDAAFNLINSPKSSTPESELWKSEIVKTWENSTFIRPDSYDQNFKGIQLKNGLTALLVTDVENNVCAASLSVGVGYINDPVDVPGLAHFLEHMLFLSNAKYPIEGDYREYLSSHGGGSNAYTSTNETNYFFQIPRDGFEEAVDRFSQFFISPMFDEDALEREVQAVNSENSKNFLRDSRRESQIIKAVSDQSHPYTKFSTGNSDTLAKKNIRERMMQFYYDNYSSDKMKLVMYCNLTMDAMLQMTVSKFKDVKLNPIKRKIPILPNPYRYLPGKHIQITPVKKVQDMALLFVVKDFTLSHGAVEHLQKTPYSSITFLLGHETEGSILHKLKAKGWANNLSVSLLHYEINHIAVKVNIQLTDEGLSKTEEIVSVVFNYIKMMKKNLPLPNFIPEEREKVHKMTFKFMGKPGQISSLSRSIASSMNQPWRKFGNKDDLHLVLSGNVFNKTHSPELVSEALDEFTVDNMFIITIHSGQNMTETEPIYNAPYGITNIDPRSILKWKKAVGEIDSENSDDNLGTGLNLPIPNVFIPSDFRIFPKTVDELPFFVTLEPNVTAWIMHVSDIHPVPKTHYSMRIRSDYSDSKDLSKFIHLHGFFMAFDDMLSDLEYACALAQSSFAFSQNDGVKIGVSGYSHKTGVLLESVSEIFFNVLKGESDSVDRIARMESRFDELIARWVRGYVSKEAEMPYHTGYYWRSKAIARPDGLNRDTILNALQTWTNISLDTSIEMVRDMFLNNDLALEFLIAGNVDVEESLDISRRLTQKLKNLTKGSRNFKDVEDPRYHGNSKVVVLPKNSVSAPARNHSCYRLQVNNTIQDNNAVFFSYELEKYSEEGWLRANILGQMLSKSVFYVLRTQKQLGYIVSSGIKTDYTAVMSFYVIIQTTHPLDMVENEIYSLVNGRLRELMNTTLKDDFGKYRLSAVNKLKNSYRNNTLENTIDLYWTEVATKRLNFNGKEEKIKLVNDITFEQIHDMYERKMVTSNGEAKVFSTWTHGTKSEYPSPSIDCQHIADYNYFHENPLVEYATATRKVGDIASYEYFG